MKANLVVGKRVKIINPDSVFYETKGEIKKVDNDMKILVVRLDHKGEFCPSDKECSEWRTYYFKDVELEGVENG